MKFCKIRKEKNGFVACFERDPTKKAAYKAAFL